MHSHLQGIEIFTDAGGGGEGGKKERVRALFAMINGEIFGAITIAR